MSDQPEQFTLSDSAWESDESPSASQAQSEQSRTSQTGQINNAAKGDTRTQQPIEDPFSFERDDLPTASLSLTQTALDSLLTNSPTAPLSDSVESIANHSPEPDSEEQRTARALFIYGRAQMGAVNGYDLSESMINLRACIEDELGIPTSELVENGYLREKHLDGRWKYYRLTTAGRRFIEESSHPTFDLLRPGVERPVVGDGPLHNRGVSLGGDWLLRETDSKCVAQPELNSETELDLGAYAEGERRWLGEVVVTEDVHSDSNVQEGETATFLKRVRYLRDRPEQSLLIFESSPVAVRALARLDTEGILDLPPSIDYRQYSIAQLRTHLLSQIEQSAFDRIESLATLMENQ